MSWPISITSGIDGAREFTVRVDPGLADGLLLRTEARFEDSVNSVAATAADVLAVATTPPLDLMITSSADPVEDGTALTFTMTVSNPGTTTLTNVILEAVTPGYFQLYPASQSSPPGACLSGSSCSWGEVMRWTLGTLSPGEVQVVSEDPVDPNDGPPPAPTGVQASQGAFNDRIRITWNSVVGADDYEVLRAQVPNIDLDAPVCPSGIAPPCNTTATSYDDATVTLGVTYYYWVKSCSNTPNVGCSIHSAMATGFAGIATLPGKATTPNPSNGETVIGAPAILDWSAGSSSTGYDVFFNGTQVAFDIVATQWMINQSLATGTHTWRVDSKNANGTTTGDTWSFTIFTASLPGKATNPDPANGATVSNSKSIFSWSAGSNASSYDVFLNSTQVAFNVSTTNWTVNQTLATGDHTWRVDSKNAVGTTSGDPWNFSVTSLVYVALGDSYSSGEGAGDYKIDINEDDDYIDWVEGLGEDTDHGEFGTTRNLCHRSSNAYSQEVQYQGQTIRAQPFIACSGAEIFDVLPSAVEGTNQDKAPLEVPQLDNSGISDADLVTITIGGNDAGFEFILNICKDEENCLTYTPENWPIPLEEFMPIIINGIGPFVQETVKQTILKAPDAHIVVLGYPMPFPKESKAQLCQKLQNPPWFGNWSQAEQNWIIGLGNQLNSVIKHAATAEGAVFLSPSTPEFFNGHEICSSDSWFVEPSWPNWFWSGLNKTEMFHPDQSGHKLGYRALLEQYLASSNLEPTVATQSSNATTAMSMAEFATVLEIPIPTIGDLILDFPAELCQPILTPGGLVSVSGEGFKGSSEVQLVLLSDADYVLGTTIASADGEISIELTLPLSLPSNPVVRVEARGQGPDGAQRLLYAFTGVAPGLDVDSDTDGIPDACNLCPDDSDPDQTDTDNDRIGDACDICPEDSGNDVDGDGSCGNVDACPLDLFNDGDSDGICGSIDNCPNVSNANQSDIDGDLVGDACDRCQGVTDLGCIFYGGFE